MQVELLSVGTELLLGQIVDTNAAYLAGKLSELGINVYHKTTVGDNTERLVAALRISLGRSDVVLATGGLGPTEDDITAAAVAEVMGGDLVEDEVAAEHIRSFTRFRGIKLIDSLLKQARVPKGATVVPNPVGTAPGFIATVGAKAVIALPGVPTEMRAMAEQTVFPHLAQRASQDGRTIIVSRVLRLAGIGESQAEAECADLIASQGNPTIAPLAKTYEVWLRLTARTPTREQAEELIAPVEAEIRRRLGDHVYGRDEESLEQATGEMLARNGLTLALAESCTGGLIGHRLTNIPGSSRYFLASLTTYSNESKTRLLGVSEELLRDHGAVSPECAAAMAEGVRRTVGADMGLSITGIAGPGGGTPEKPVGLAYVGLSQGDNTVTEELRLRGDREMIKERCAQSALYFLYRKLRTAHPAGVAE
ncbi:MAG: competence/damage-inducible protein A [Armatimonadetes bacterium]|nr:competence/damage-inducible protein A [Armatimonadota bacterium]